MASRQPAKLFPEGSIPSVCSMKDFTSLDDLTEITSATWHDFQQYAESGCWDPCDVTEMLAKVSPLVP